MILKLSKRISRGLLEVTSRHNFNGLKRKRNMEKEYWLFTLLTGNNSNQYINCWYEWFPSKQELIKACRDCSDCEEYAIINVTKFTEEQYNKLTKDGNEK